MVDINSEQKLKIVSEKGFLDIDIDISLDLFAEIEKLKKKRTQSSLRTITRSRIYRM